MAVFLFIHIEFTVYTLQKQQKIFSDGKILDAQPITPPKSSCPPPTDPRGGSAQPIQLLTAALTWRKPLFSLAFPLP
jgi:hypothetical protein